MSYGKFKLTKKGLALLSKVQAGAKLKLTRIAVGSGEIEDLKELINLENLIEYKQTYQITDIRPDAGGTAVVKTIITNKDIETGFFLREIGLFAEDPNEGEILYAITNTGEYADYLPAKSFSETNIDLEIITVIGDSENLEINIDTDLVYATKKELYDLAGTGRTIENVKQNADNIQSLAIEVGLLKQAALTNFTGSNMFLVSMKELSVEETFEGVWNVSQKRLEV